MLEKRTGKMNKVFEGLEEAVGFFMRELQHGGYAISSWKPCHYNEKFKKYVHAEIYTTRDGIKELFYVMYKREFFMTASRYFPDARMGFAESMNMEVFDRLMLKQPDYLVFIHPEDVLFCDWETFRNYVARHDTKRTQDSGVEETFSIDIKYLRTLLIQTPKVDNYLKGLIDKVYHAIKVVTSNVKHGLGRWM